MPRVCTVCTHADRELVDAALVQGRPSKRAIAAHFGVTPGSLGRHAKDHLPELLAKAHEAAEVVRADDLLERLRQREELADAITAAACSGSWDPERIPTQTEVLSHVSGGFVLPMVALRGIRDANRTTELLARLEGELPDSATQEVYVVFDENWRTGG